MKTITAVYKYVSSMGIFQHGDHALNETKAHKKHDDK